MEGKQTIPRFVRDHVEASPDRVLMTFRDLGGTPATESALSYGSLWTGACVFAEALQGVARGGRALIVMPINTRLFEAHLGVQLAGAIPIIHSHPSAKVDHTVYVRHLGHVLDLLAPEVVITTREFSTAVHSARPDAPWLLVAQEDLPTRSDFQPHAWEATRADDVAIIQHSSGSTGLQKGVALTHAMVSRQCTHYARAIALDPYTDCVCSWIPLYHDMGLFTTWLLPLLSGVRVAAIDPFKWVAAPSSLLRLITDHRGTLCWQPNFAYNLLATRVPDHDLEGVSLATMRAFINCSEPVRARSHQLFLDRFRHYGMRDSALHVCYAMAENAFAVTHAGNSQASAHVLACDPVALSENRVEPPVGGRSAELVSCGSPIEQCEVKVADESRRDIGERRIGEVALRSDHMLREYFRNPEATARAIDADSWFYTGDLGCLADGELYITGRKKDLLIVGGRNFYPQDLEHVCDSISGVIPGRSVAIGVADESTGTERIVVLVESHDAADPAACRRVTNDLRLSVIEKLDCQVSEVHVVPHLWLLKTTSGKIARAPNLERYRKEFQDRSDQSAPAPVPRVAVRRASVAATVGWSLLIAFALYLLVALQPSLSWGVYAGF
jgi:fatty-acyl-CoA synthase